MCITLCLQAKIFHKQIKYYVHIMLYKLRNMRCIKNMILIILINLKLIYMLKYITYIFIQI